MDTKTILVAALAASAAVGTARGESAEASKAASGALFAEGGSETGRAAVAIIDAATRAPFDALAGADGAALQRRVRIGEAELLRRTINESPLLQRALAEAGAHRTWSEVCQERRMDAAVASWRSSMRAGYLWGTAPAYATFATAPPVVAEVGGALLWAGGVVVGAAAGLLQSALVGHL